MKLYSVLEVAQICSVTKPTIHNWIKAGQLKALNFPYGRKKVQEEDLRNFLKQNGMELPTQGVPVEM